MIRYQCPSCQREYESATVLGGLTVICLTCLHPMVIPKLKKSDKEDVMAGPAPLTPVASNSSPERRREQPLTLADRAAAVLSSAVASGAPLPELSEAIKPSASIGAGTAASVWQIWDLPRDFPEIEKVREQDRSMRRVTMGLSLCLFALALNFAAMALVFLAATYPLWRELPSAETLMLFLRVSMWLVFAAALVEVVGWWLCLVVPQETGAHHLIYWAVLLNILAALAAILGLASWLGWIQLAIPDWMALPIRASRWTAQILFLLFLRKLAAALGESGIETTSIYLVVIGVMLIALSAFQCLEVFFACIALGAAALALVWCVLLVLVLVRLRSAICERLIDAY
ncbi:MAG: hypothetical protein L0215_14625 [Gemmataceae bacterium]|nr:hypothetical protein [Gemmataceae bacterium]